MPTRSEFHSEVHNLIIIKKTNMSIIDLVLCMPVHNILYFNLISS